MKSRLVASLVALTTVGVALPAAGFVFFRARDSDEPMRWFRKSLEFRISTAATAQDFPPSEVLGQAEQAFDAWVETACGKVPDVVFMGDSGATTATTPTRISDDPDNVIVFIASSSQWVARGNTPTMIAITKIAHDTRTGEIIDADIEINDGGFTFTLDGNPTSQQVDFLSMMTHEVGHYFGLDHSLDTTATMFANHSREGEGATQARTLAQDDIDGICALYTDVPDSPHEGGGDGDSGNGCAGGSHGIWGLLAFSMLGLGARMRRWPASSSPR